VKDHREDILERLHRLGRILGSGADRVLVVGGSAPATYGLQPVQVRETADVDLVVRASSYADYAKAQTWLEGFGFAADVETDTVCSFVGQDLKLDLMPTPYEDLGFNRWYGIRPPEPRQGNRVVRHPAAVVPGHQARGVPRPRSQ
jgi:hypothetical protein